MQFACAFLALLSAASPAAAQEWPARPVRIIVPFPPGGAAEALPRIVGEKLAVRFKQPFIARRARRRGEAARWREAIRLAGVKPGAL